MMAAKLIWWGSGAGLGRMQAGLGARYGADDLGIPHDVHAAFGQPWDTRKVISLMCSSARVDHGYNAADRVPTRDESAAIETLGLDLFAEPDLTEARARGWCVKLITGDKL